jgi:hypothetical protein
VIALGIGFYAVGTRIGFQTLIDLIRANAVWICLAAIVCIGGAIGIHEWLSARLQNKWMPAIGALTWIVLVPLIALGGLHWFHEFTGIPQNVRGSTYRGVVTGSLPNAFGIETTKPMRIEFEENGSKIVFHEPRSAFPLPLRTVGNRIMVNYPTSSRVMQSFIPSADGQSLEYELLSYDSAYFERGILRRDNP